MNISSSTHTFRNTRYVDYDAISKEESDGQLHLKQSCWKLNNNELIGDLPSKLCQSRSRFIYAFFTESISPGIFIFHYLYYELILYTKGKSSALEDENYSSKRC